MILTVPISSSSSEDVKEKRIYKRTWTVFHGSGFLLSGPLTRSKSRKELRALFCCVCVDWSQKLHHKED
jgi:hypothetical protein